ncbi:glycosyltransferase involved in cell wall biosynthesis [Flavobacterium cutihirudinis]|uniref:Glycosyltransferase involved in cell wall biosynthesis n=1 Tax=Flavobacterium cutihirudinis TaxID=1265740 RepID=A0A3D9FK72_9FLAO|nr:glycosyltransferase family 2 protein [Flavobacterium cutihirudinis]RED19579.1 glycosyltransferase involved in cell wall biosynthesis [Flavobacterium cutihirudinis]
MATVSIIIPSYNHSGFLKERLNSIAKQTFIDWEAVIIDDNSTDDSVSIIKEFLKNNSDFKVSQFIVNPENSGSGYISWQKGIKLAQTKYIWIAETDDYSEPTFLEELVNILEQDENISLAFCGSNYVENEEIIYDSTNRTKDLEVEKTKTKIIDSAVFLNQMPFNPYITNGSSVLFRKPNSEIPNQIFTHKQSSDIFLWSYLIQNKSFAYLNKNLNFFRRHQGSTTSILHKNNLEMIYYEKAKFLNYFGKTHMYKEFIDHYIQHYIWNNKKDFLNISSIKTIQKEKNLKIIYFYTLTKFSFYKIFNCVIKIKKQ